MSRQIFRSNLNRVRTPISRTDAISLVIAFLSLIAAGASIYIGNKANQLAKQGLDNREQINTLCDIVEGQDAQIKKLGLIAQSTNSVINELKKQNEYRSFVDQPVIMLDNKGFSFKAGYETDSLWQPFSIKNTGNRLVYYERAYIFLLNINFDTIQLLHEFTYAIPKHTTVEITQGSPLPGEINIPSISHDSSLIYRNCYEAFVIYYRDFQTKERKTAYWVFLNDMQQGVIDVDDNALADRVKEWIKARKIKF
jgi:hypothetical protein